MKLRQAAALALLCGAGVSVGCADAKESDSANSSTPKPVESFTDEVGGEWLRTGAAVYDLRSTAEIVAELQQKGADLPTAEPEPEPDPEALTDAQWGKLMEPVTEFGGSEYRMTSASLRSYGAKLRKAAIERKRNPAIVEGKGAQSLRGGDVVSRELPSQAGTDKAIVGSNDNRIGIDHMRNTWPYSMHATMESSSAVCTAFKVVNHYTAGTAAHCVHSGSGWRPRSTLTFADGSRGKVNKDCYAMTVPGEWIDHPNLPKNDYAVIALRKTSVGTWCTTSTFDLGYFGTRSVAYTEETNGFVSGYPSSDTMPPGLSGYPHLVYHWMDGAEVGVVQTRVLQYYNDTTGGQSGSPFVSWYGGNDYRVRAIHKGERGRAFADNNQGREFDGTVLDFVRSNGGS